MDEFKYRVWDFVNKKMLPVCLIRRNADGSITVNATDNIDCWNPIQVSGKHKNGELLRYIGLKDKNKIDISEGDFLGDPKNQQDIGLVVADQWNCNCCGGVYGFALERQDNIGNHADLREHDKMIIIGNKYQNPELLKGGDK